MEMASQQIVKIIGRFLFQRANNIQGAIVSGVIENGNSMPAIYFKISVVSPWCVPKM